METKLTEDQTFERTDFANDPLSEGEYDHCTFIDCDLSNADFSNITFSGCEFLGCNLSLCKLTKTSLTDVKFKDCKMLGLHVEDCSQFGLSFSFDNCNLTHSSFYQAKIRKTIFKNSLIYEVDFSECDLTGSVFDNCDLTRSTFDRTNLEKADFRRSFNYSINPATNKIRKARFSLTAITGLLDAYDIVIDKTS